MSFAFNAPSSTTYIAEWEVSVAPNSQVGMNVSLRCSSGGTCYFLQVNTVEQTLQLFFAGPTTTFQELTALFPVARMREGRVFTVAVVFEATRVTLFLDEKQVGEAAATQIPASSFNPGAALESRDGGTGAIRFVAARYYALP